MPYGTLILPGGHEKWKNERFRSIGFQKIKNYWNRFPRIFLEQFQNDKIFEIFKIFGFFENLKIFFRKSWKNFGFSIFHFSEKKRDFFFRKKKSRFFDFVKIIFFFGVEEYFFRNLFLRKNVQTFDVWGFQSDSGTPSRFSRTVNIFSWFSKWKISHLVYGEPAVSQPDPVRSWKSWDLRAN